MNTRLSKYILPFFFLQLLSFALEAQSITRTLRRYDLEDGLSSPHMRTITEDNDGFIWIGTRKGLDRFDGREFQNFPLGTLSKGLNMFVTVYDGQEHIWLKNQNKLLLFNINTHRYQSFVDVFPKSKINPDAIRHIRQNGNQLILILKNNDVFLYNKTFSKIFNGQLVQDNGIIQEATDSILWLVQDHVLINLDYSGNAQAEYQLPYHPLKSLIDNRGDLWLGSGLVENNNILIRIRNGKLNTLNIEIDEHSVFNTVGFPSGFNVFYDPRGAYSINVINSWNSYDLQLRPLENLALRIKNKFNTDFGRALSPYRDQNGNYWILTYDGLFFINSKVDDFERILNTEPKISTRAMTEYNGNIYVNTYSGGKIFNKLTNSISSWRPKSRSVSITTKNNQFYIGGYAPWLLRHHNDLTIIDTIYFAQPVLRTNQVFFDAMDNLWVATPGYLGLLDPSINQVINTNLFPENTHIHHIIAEGKNVWLGTSAGLYNLDVENRTVTPAETLKGIPIVHVHIRANGTFWMGTSGFGLVSWNPKTDEVEARTTSDELSDNHIHGVYEDYAGYLWLPSDRGLMRYHINSNSVEVFREEDGITHNEFNLLSHFQDSDSTLYFGGLNGLTIVRPRNFGPMQNRVRNIIFTRIEVLRSGTWTSLDQKADMVELTASDNGIRLDFAALDYLNGKNLRYAYQLEGQDSDWVVLDDNTLRFSGLPPGKYVLKIKVIGKGNNDFLELPIIVIPPFVQTWPFYLLVLSLLFLLYLLRIRFYKRQKAYLESTVTQRTSQLLETQSELKNAIAAKDKIFGIVAHDIRNAVLAFRDIRKKTTYLLKNKQVDRLVELGDEIDASGNTVRELLDNLINWARSEQGAMPYKPENINLLKEWVKAVEANQGHIDKKGIHIESDISEDLMLYCDPVGLGIIFRNLLNNAIKFSPAQSTISITAEVQRKNIAITIKDEGMGIPEDKLAKIFELSTNKSTKGTKGEKGAGIGLMLIHAIVIQNKGSIAVASEVDKGSTFIVTLPSVKP